jgi:hypothetical protein
MRRPLRFGDLRGLTTPPKRSPKTLELHEIETDAEAAPTIRKYLQLADMAQGLGSRPFLVERQKHEAGTYVMRLRVESGAGLPINDYRITHGYAEMRLLDPAGHRYPGEGSSWRILDESDIALHHALGTVVSKWLRVRLGKEAVALDTAA